MCLYGNFRHPNIILNFQRWYINELRICYYEGYIWYFEIVLEWMVTFYELVFISVLITITGNLFLNQFSLE